MYYKIDWCEEETNHVQRGFQAKDLPTLWKAVHYMNQERIERHRPKMDKMQITVLTKYYGNYSVISGAYSKDLLLDVID